MKRFLCMFAIIVLGFLLQGTVFPELTWLKTTPNLLIIIICAFGMCRGKKDGLTAGLICGLLMDFIYGDVIGFYSLIYMYIGYMTGFFQQYFFTDNLIIPLLCCAGSDFLYGFYIFFFRFALRNRLNFNFYLNSIILPEMVYTVLIALVLFHVIVFLNRKIEEIEKRRDAKFV